MRLPLLLSLAATSAVAASAAAPPVRVNGWYRCGASTLGSTADTTNFHDDEYFLETTGGDDIVSINAAAAVKGLRHPHTTPHSKRSSNKAPHVPRRPDAPGETAMLGDPLEFARSHASWRARKDSDDRKSKSLPNRRGHGKQFFDNNGGDSSSPRYECAEFRVPYCYEGICESKRTMDIFVKRVLAKNHKSSSDSGSRAKSLWLLQGGPGASSTAMEDLMESMYDELKGDVSIYTMDHRGTARSNRLECQAAEAQTPGSPGGTYIVLEEFPNCIDDILFQTDNLTAAFSVTSAAMDLRTVIDHTLADEDVFVYGLSYGTYLVERLIHVPPASVKGFIIDGIVSEAGANIEERSTYSNWDHDVGVVGSRFLGYCESDAYCKAKFAHVPDLTQFVKDLYKQLDKDALHPGTSACADALQDSGKKPSYFLRSAFGELLMDDGARVLIPAIVYRAARCSKEDAEALHFFVDLFSGPVSNDSSDLDEVLFTSQMLYSLIVFSEMWESPSPGIESLIKWYEDSVVGSDNYVNFPAYCLFTGSREQSCKNLKHLPKSRPLMYERDAYWNQTAKLPENVSALLMSGGLDLQTRRMYGNLQYELLGGNRMLIQFDYAGHCTTFTTPTKSGGPTCGVQILASYVRNDGDVSRVDTSCIGDVYGLDFHVSSDMAEEYLGVQDGYA